MRRLRIVLLFVVLPLLLIGGCVTMIAVKMRRKADCPVCGDRPTITAPIDYEEFCRLRGGATSPSEVSS